MTSEGDEVNNVINAHDKHIVTGEVMFSDRRVSKIQSMCPDVSLSQPNEWQMPLFSLWTRQTSTIMQYSMGIYVGFSTEKIVVRQS